MLFVNKAFAQTVSASTPTIKTSIGGITNLQTLMQWLYNFLMWIGWAGVILGVAFAIFGLIYKLFAGDNEETMKNVQGYITRAVLIVIAGLLLVSLGFIINVVFGVTGATVPTNNFATPTAP